MEAKLKDRGWVKNAAIIFLAVLLILTFFSNTIMNHSLPEVATQAISSGSITARIRGTGTVTANQNYEVMIDQSRRVKTVMIKAGQEVNVGDVLFVLSEADSDELEQARNTLRQLEKSYQTALINAAGSGSAQGNQTVQRARAALEDTERTLDRLGYTDRTGADWEWLSLSDAKDAAAAAQKRVDTAGDAVTRATEELSDLGVTKPTQDSMDTLSRTLEDKRKAVTEAENALDATMLIYGKYYEWISGRAEMQIKQTSGYKALSTDRERKQYIEEKLPTYAKHVRDQIADGELFPYNARSGYLGNGEYGLIFDAAEAAPYTKAYEEVNAAQEALETARDAYDAALRDYSKAQTDSGDYLRLQQALDAAKEEQRAATAAKADADEALQTLQTAIESLKSNRSALEDALKQSQLDALEISDLSAQVAQQREKVEELSDGSVNAEIRAEVSGTIGSVNITAGQTTVAKSPMATIEVPDMGYNLSFSVTNDQARRVHTGDAATAANMYWGNQIDAVLTGIKTDPKDPQNSKQLTFELHGDVTPGSSLTLSVGQRSADYDFVVPNSALRSDSNGDFILVIVARNSPLGDRYIATRVDVTKLAGDDTATAVTGALNAGDFVITTSTAPIKNGDRVRLADSVN